MPLQWTKYVYFTIAVLIAWLCANMAVVAAKKKTILLWYLRNSSQTWPFDAIGTGNSFFVKYKCKYRNCYVSTNQKEQQRENAFSYDAVLFSGSDSSRMSDQDLPRNRSEKQFYVFLSLDSAGEKPVCQKHFDDFFNWTMTYKLSSDIPWTHFRIKQHDNTTIGPRISVPWMNPRDMINVEQSTQAKLYKKTKIAAWFVGDCRPKKDGKTLYVKALSDSLFKMTGQRVDVYGACGDTVGSDVDVKRTNRMLDKDYLFYLAFENYHDEDYVTDKLLTALENFNVPVVYGGADYNRFAPPGSYLNAAKHPPFKLAGVMAFLYKKRDKLNDFHKWRNYYYYIDNYDMASVFCNLCAKLNKDKTPKMYSKFRHWWNPRYDMKCRHNITRLVSRAIRRIKKSEKSTSTITPPTKATKKSPTLSFIGTVVSFVSKPLGFLISSIK